ncbi:MAG: chemotaxis protein CheA [Fibrobacteres bacterium]|nr:chemotaxis protein CheA [Fibrobacterota bacterium]
MNQPSQQIEKVLADLRTSQRGLPHGEELALAGLLSAFDDVCQISSAPAAMKTLARRLSSSVFALVRGDTQSAAELPKLVQGVEKLAKALEQIVTQDAPKVPAPLPPEPSMPDSLKEPPSSIDRADLVQDLELLKRFVERLGQDLEGFEVAVLEREKGVPEGSEIVNRYLHTLKGEFGVLDLLEWSALIHEVETALAARKIGTEGLLRVKDLLEEKAGILHTSSGRRVGDEMRARIFAASVSSESQASVGQDTPGESTFTGDTTFLVDFIAEGGDHIRNIEKSLLRLETAPTDEESLNLVFRSCHTLKGLAGFLELKEIQALAHAAESLMDRARNHKIVLQPQHVDVLLETTDAFRVLVDGLEGIQEGGTYKAPANLTVLIERLREADTLPPMEGILHDQPPRRMGELLVDQGVDPAAVERALNVQRAGDSRPLGEILLDQGDVEARKVGQALGQQVENKRAQAPQAAMGVEESVRVPVQRLDLLIDAIGEAVIAQSMVWADPRLMANLDLAVEKKIAQASLMMRQIQELSMSLRMVGIRSTFQKMSRLVRDLARKLEKQIDLTMEGEDTELDKTVVENIGDPLIHMVRNSVDHGVETPAERVAAGKNPHGTVHLRAFHKAGSVFIEIEDDGKGLDRDAILRKAIASGKARAEQNYTDAEVYQMVFLPGLSTAKSVTDVSGRGVGMDVVKRNIEALRGTVEIRSEKGKGTCFSIRLPLTLAIIQGMVIQVGEEKYIVPTLSILSTQLLNTSNLHTVVAKGEMIDHHGELVRLLRLEDVFNSPTSADPTQCVVLVVEDSVGHKVGLVADRILEQQQVVIKNLGAMGHVPGVSGGAIMSDGSVSLILDVGGVVKLASGDR